MSHSRRPVRLEGADHAADDLYDWEKVDRAAGRPGAVLGAGHGLGLPRDDPGLPGGRGRPPDHRPSLGTVFREEIAEPLGADFHIGLPASRGRPRRRADPAAARPAVAERAGARRAAGQHGRQPGIDVDGDPDPRPGAAPRSRRPAAPATPARSPRSTRSWPTAASPKGKRFMSEAGCRKALELQIEGSDLVLGVPARFGLGFGLDGGVMPLPNPNTHLLGRLRRLAGDHRHGCAHDLRLRHEQDGRHHHRRHARRSAWPWPSGGPPRADRRRPATRPRRSAQARARSLGRLGGVGEGSVAAYPWC